MPLSAVLAVVAGLLTRIGYGLYGLTPWSVQSVPEIQGCWLRITAGVRDQGPGVGSNMAYQSLRE
jgi:hypothetical protein